MDFEYADRLNQAIRLLSLRHRARIATMLTPLGLHPGQEAVLLEIARNGPQIQAKLGHAIGCESPSVTLMTRKLETAGFIQRRASDTDRRASVVDLTDAGRDLVEQIKEVWVALADETVTGMDSETLDGLPEVLQALSANVDTRRPVGASRQG